jgi:hypothetical protein
LPTSRETQYSVDQKTGLMWPVLGDNRRLSETPNLESVVSEPANEENKVVPINPNPTGTPIIPPKVVPWLTALAVLAGVVASGPAIGLTFVPPAVVGVATALLAVLTALGIASPGIRKPSP